MWELDCEEGWVPKNWCFWTVVLEKEDSWEPLGLQGDPTSPFWRRSALGVLWSTYAKTETPILGPLHAKRWLIGKDSDAGRDWGQEEKGTTEDEMAGWHHWLNVNESQWTPGVGDGQRGMVCYVSWGRKESDTTEWLIWSDAREKTTCGWRKKGTLPLFSCRAGNSTSSHQPKWKTHLQGIG